MSTDIGPRIGIDGEAEFRKQLTNINQQLKTLGTEMKAVTSAFDANDSSQEALAAQAGVLTRQIETQEQKLSQLQKGLEASAQKYGENDTRTLKWAAAVNNATADLNKMRAQLSKVEGEMDGTSDASDDLADGMEQAGDAADRSNGKFSAATVAIGNLASSAITAAVSAIGDLVSSLWNLDSSTEEYRIARGGSIPPLRLPDMERIQPSRHIKPSTAFWAIQTQRLRHLSSWRSWRSPRRTLLPGPTSPPVSPAPLATASRLRLDRGQQRDGEGGPGDWCPRGRTQLGGHQ